MTRLPLIALLLCACTQTPPLDAPLLPGIDAVRDAPRVKATCHPDLLSTTAACLSDVYGPLESIVMVATLQPSAGCAWVPYNPDGICRVHYTCGDSETLEHEIRHCQGLDHGNTKDH